MKSKQQEVRENFLHKHVQNPSATYKSIAKVLIFCKTTVSMVIFRYLDASSVTIKPVSRGEHNQSNKKLAQSISQSFDTKNKAPEQVWARKT